MTINVYEVVLLIPLLLLTTTLFLRRYRHYSDRPYGPPTYPIIGCLPSFYKNQRRLLDWYTDLLSSSPTQTISIKRMGVGPIIVTANPSNVEYILKNNFANYPKGKPFSELVKDLLGIGIFNVDGELWSSQRKLASHEFSTKSLKEFVVSILEEEVNQRLIPLLEEACGGDDKGGLELDLQDILKRFTYDTICKVSLGTDPECLDLRRPSPPLITAFDQAATICAMRSASPVYLIWKLKRLFNVGTEKQLKESVQIVHGSVEQIIADKTSELKSANHARGSDHMRHHDLLSRMLSAGMSGELARDMVISFILAGRDTSSAAMTWLFWLLTQNSEVEAKMVSELLPMRVNNSNGFGSSTKKKMDYEDLKEMKYLHACLCEAMRLYPPVAWDSKHADTDDVLPDGTKVKSGERVTYFPYGMGRMEKLWGENRFEFQPERWFEEEDAGDQLDAGGKEMVKGLKGVSPYVFPVFQAGPRVCLGKEMAFIQMKYVVASILERFEFEAVYKDKPVFVPLFTAHMAGGFKVRVRRRKGLDLAR